MDKPKAYSYIRFSTPEQQKGDSLRRQAEISAEYARVHGLELDEKLTFRDLGVSAFNSSNLRSGGQLRAFLDAIDQGIVLPGSYLLVESLDRISRAEILDALEIFTSILNRGITIVTIGDKMVYSKAKANKNFTDLIISIAIMARAHEESATKRDRIKEAWSAKRKNAGEQKLTRICPAWLKLNDSRAAYDPIPEKVAVVRRIVDLVMSGMGKNAIAKKFNQEEVPSIGGRNADKTWFPSYVDKIASSRALIGEFQPMQVADGKRVPAGEPLCDYFPRIISDEQFALMQQLVSERGTKSGGNRGKNFSNLFSGIVKCGYCGSTMVFVNKGEDRRRQRDATYNRFLVCSKAKRGAGCFHLPWTYNELEEAFIRFAKGVDFAQFVRASSDQARTAQSLRDNIAITRANRDVAITRRDNLIDALAQVDAQPTSVVERILKHEAEIKELSDKLVKLEGELQSAVNLESIARSALEDINVLLDRLRSQAGDELFLLRARINENLRRVVRELVLFPGGTIHTDEEVKQIKGELQSTGRYSDSDIDAYAREMLPTQPRKHDKYFVLKNRDQVLQMLKPNHEFPDIMDTFINNPGLLHDWVKREKAKHARLVFSKWQEEKQTR